MWVVDANSSQWVQFAPSAPTTGPVGTIVDFIGATAPTGWLTMIGQTIASGETFYPALWAVLPASMKSGTSIVLPDTRGRFVVSLDANNPGTQTPGALGGEANHVLTTAEMPSHGHGVAGPDGHSWGVLYNQATAAFATFGFRESTVNQSTNFGVLRATEAGGGAAHNNMPPFISFLKILRVV